MKITPYHIFLLVFGHYLLPVMLISRLVSREMSVVMWALSAAASGGYCLFMYRSGRWDWFGFWTRYALPVGFAAAVIASFPIHAPIWQQGDVVESVANLILTAIVVVLIIRSYLSLPKDATSVSLLVPLVGRRFYVAHGGANSLINYHAVHETQRYALDFVQLNGWGARASGVYPKQLERYQIYDCEVTAPCDGRIVHVENEHPDLVPPELDSENRAGNHIVMEISQRPGCYVVLAHLKQGSIVVAPGEQVNAGVLLGRIGNSGATTEPHLHIHACVDCQDSDYVGTGQGVPIEFSDRFLVRNQIVDGMSSAIARNLNREDVHDT